MRSAIVAAAFAAGAIAVPYKRDVVTDVDVVTATVYATVWADAEPSTSAAPAAVTTTVTTQQHYGHSWIHHKSSSTAESSPAAYTPASSSQAPAPAPSSSEAPVSSAAPAPSTYEAPATSAAPSSYEAPSSSAAPASSYQAPSSSAASSAAPTDYVGKALLHHNLHRANHSSTAAVWNASLAATAQKISDTCKYAHSMDVDNTNYGQNIAAGVPADNVTAVITDLWYNSEVLSYYQQNTTGSTYESWGHFSQMVWDGSTQIGCATTDCSKNPNKLEGVGSLVAPHFTVCNYLTRGNVGGEYNTNVLQSLDHPTIEYNYGL